MLIIVEEFPVYSNFLSSLLCFATKSDPEIELRFIQRQFNKRLKMEQLKEIIKIAYETSGQEASLKLVQFLESRK